MWLTSESWAAAWCRDSGAAAAGGRTWAGEGVRRGWKGEEVLTFKINVVS